MNEDSGSLGKIYLYSQSGNKIATYSFPGIGVNDMEDLAYQTHDNNIANTIYIGDFGDNNYRRSNCKIIVISDRTMTTGEEFY